MTIRSRLPGTSAAATSHNVTIPGDAATGDRVVVGFVNDIASATTSPSTGWTSLDTEPEGTTTNHRLTIFSRVLDGTANDSLTVTLTDGGDGNSAEAAWVSVCLTGDGGLPASQVALTGGGAATTGTVTAITGLASDDYDSIVFLGLDNSVGASQTPTAPTGWGNPQTAGTSSDAIYAFSMDQSSSPTTGFSPDNVTWDSSEQWLTGHVVVASAAGGGGGEGGTVPVVRSVTSNAEANTPDVVVSKPAGLAVGDYLLAFQESDSDGTLASMSAPSGFVELSSQAPTPATNIPPAKVWGKAAVQADVDATTFAFPDNTGSNCTVVLLAIQADTYDPTTPVSTPSWNTQGDATDANITAPSITGAVDALLLTAHMPDTGNVVRSFSSGPSGMTLTHQSAAGNSTYTRIGVYQLALSADGATGAKTAVLSATPDGYAATALLINPAPSDGAAHRTSGFLMLL